MGGLEISIVIPAFNEAARIGITLEKIKQYLEEIRCSAEVLVVDDGSTDPTTEIVRKYGATWPSLRLVQNPANRGKGFSVRNGALQARGEIILFTDADLSAPITEMPKLVNPIQDGHCDVTFGSRAIDRSLIGIRQSPFREYSGRVFNVFVQVIAGLPFKDTQCGFKAFRRACILPVFERQTVTGFGFDPELLYIARNRGLRLMEIPVRWDNAEGTTVHFTKDSLRMFLDLVRIRWNDLKGKYR
jgi:dolichyl-phosphate beta-glucosyltransferase